MYLSHFGHTATQCLARSLDREVDWDALVVTGLRGWPPSSFCQHPCAFSTNCKLYTMTRTTADSFLTLHPHLPKQALPHLIMATLRLLTLCAIVSTALSFVAMGPPSRHTAAATTRPTFTAWGSRGRTSQVGTLAAGTLRLGMCWVLCVCVSQCVG